MNINELNNIVKRLESEPFNTAHLGLKDGAMGISLFFFLYARFTNKEIYEDKAIELLEKVLENISSETPQNYAFGVVGIGSAIDFLIKENLIKADSMALLNDIDTFAIAELRKNMPVDFSFETGILGLSHYLLQRSENNTEAIQLTLEHLLSGFSQTYCVEPRFLFPSEILQDVKLFLFRLKDNQAFSTQIGLLNSAIEVFEKTNTILQSNCPEYSIQQALRKAGINRNRKDVLNVLSTIVDGSSDIVLQGFACMNLENPELPAWWKLY